MNALESSVEDLMTPDPAVVDPEDGIDVAETVMRLGRANEWPVASGRSLLGVVTIGDLVLARDGDSAVDRPQPTCAGVMTAAAIVAHPSDPLSHAARVMQRHRLSCLPVVAHGELVGLITLTELVELAVGLLEGEARRYGAAPIVAHLMTCTPITVSPDSTLATAEALMAAMPIRHLPVCEHDRLVGIVAQRDLVWALRAMVRPASEVLVGDVMTPKPKTATPDCEAARAGRMLLQHGIGALPVVRGERLIGILSKRDFLRHLLSLAPPARAWS
ncbi:MAG TPA: CBS domain-containing protein [Polyangia bacterium]